jgi:hypothetical protein
VKVTWKNRWLEVIAWMNEHMCYPKILFFSKIDSSKPQPETESMKMSNQEILAYWN